MDQRTLLYEIISLLKDVRKKKIKIKPYNVALGSYVPLNFCSIKHCLNSLKQSHYSLKVYNQLKIGCAGVYTGCNCYLFLKLRSWYVLIIFQIVLFSHRVTKVDLFREKKM